MSPVDFSLTTKILECSHVISKNEMLTCSLEDTNDIVKEAINVSFLYLESMYQALPTALLSIMQTLMILTKRNFLLDTILKPQFNVKC